MRNCFYQKISSTAVILALIMMILPLTGCFLDESSTTVETVTDTGDTADSDMYLYGYEGKKIGVVTGMVCDQVCEQYIPGCKVVYYNSNADLAMSLNENKIDAYMVDEPVARLLIKEYDNQKIKTAVTNDSYGYIFPKNNSRSSQIKIQLNDFISILKSNDEIQEIDDIWFGDDDSLKTIDYSQLPSNPEMTLNFAVSTNMGEPFTYVKYGNYVGYDIDIVYRFCKKYGYGLNIIDYDFGGMLSSISAGVNDLGGSCITITEERKESVDFSDPNYIGGFVLIVNSEIENGPAESDDISMLTDDIATRFEKTFIREDRWKLFVNGLFVTFSMSLISAVTGTALGFLIFLLYRKEIKLINIIIDAAATIIKINPIVVILMILYYVVFASSGLDSIWISCIGFTIIFTFVVLGLIKVAVGAVSKGQMEAARAMGYSDTHAFLRIILPQAMQHFYPGFRNAIVDLIKATAVVGYIAVQDLTKVSDIVRSRTYEAFFPLIASAVIYSLVAFLLMFIVRRVQVRTNPKKRSRDKILKGADKE